MAIVGTLPSFHAMSGPLPWAGTVVPPTARSRARGWEVNVRVAIHYGVA